MLNETILNIHIVYIRIYIYIYTKIHVAAQNYFICDSL